MENHHSFSFAPSRLAPVLCLSFLALGTSGAVADEFDSHATADAFAAEIAALAPAFEVPHFATAPAQRITYGDWSTVIPWTPHIPVSAATLPDGRILTFSSNKRTTFPGGVEFTYAATWNPATGQFVEFNHPSHDMFCAGICTLTDGRVLVNGGNNKVTRTSIFDWRTNTWTRVQEMTGGRWYNPTIALPDGQAFTATGTGTGMNTAERWNNSNGWSLLSGIPWANVFSDAGYIKEWHPHIALAPDGRLLHFGPTDTMHWITTGGNGSLTNSGTTVPGTHYPKEGCYVMYDEGRVIVAGGGANTTTRAGSDGTTGTSTGAAFTVNLNTTPPTITSIPSMAYARQFANTVVLPNGEVLVIGGNGGLKFNDAESVLPCEMWNPSTNQWRTLASVSVPRNYHSLALLLPDGRVLSGGGGLSGNAADHQDAQIFTPPSLFKADGSAADRPVLTAAPARIGPGVVFNVSGTPGLTKFSFIRMSALTHSVNTDLRQISLPFTEVSAGNYQVTSRSNLNVMNPGYWMLFGVKADGSWSEAKIIQVDATNAISVASPGAQSGYAGTAASLTLIGSGPAGATLTWSATGLPAGLAIQPSTGVISGTPTTAGTSNVTVTLSGSGAPASATFAWTIHPVTVAKNYPSFPDASGLTLNNNAAIVAPALRLTPNLLWQSGSAWLTTPLPIGADTSFATRFVFQIAGTADGADGMTFTVQGNSANALGTDGSGLGVDGISQSLTLEIDNYQGAGDPDGNHVGITTGGATTSHLATYMPPFDLESGTPHTAWVEYDGTTDTLRVYLAQGNVSTRPPSPVLTQTGIDLRALTGPQAWFGFTGATGGLGNNQDVLAWNLSVNAFALPAAPVFPQPAAQVSATGSPDTLQLTATDANNDPLTWSATGLPAGLGINAGTGLISGTPATAGSYTVTASVTDGNTAAASRTFTWTVNPPLAVTLPGAAPAGSGSSVSVTAGSTGGANPRYKFNWGDGSATTAYSASPTATHTYTAPGRYRITLTATDDTGRTVTSTYYQSVHAPLTAARPTASSAILFEDRATGADRIWTVNPDNDSVSIFNASTRARIAEVPTGAGPHALALAPDGRVWVVNTDAATISILTTATPAVAATVTLTPGSRPFGLAFDPVGSDAWLACENTGLLLRLNPSTGAQTGSVTIGQDIRHVSVNAASDRVLVSRFITPALPGENTATVTTDSGATHYGGQVISVNPATLTIERTTILQHSNAADTVVSGRGIPNYLGAAVISPDGLSAWVPSKQDNIKRGNLRDGLDLTHDLSVRSVVSRIPLTSGLPALTDDLPARVDQDNAGIPSASVFDSKGIYLFTALEGSREVTVIDTFSHTEIFRFTAGIAPQGLALSPDDRTLYVHNFMSRTVTVHDVSSVIDGLDTAPTLTAALNAVTTEKLSATILKGKQFFYDARDARLAFQQYISCASCHNDGGHDGRTWDFTQFGEGLRNTISLRGHGGTAQGPLHWSGNFDEVQDFEGQIRGFAGGTGLMSDALFHTGTRDTPMGTPKAGVSADLDALAAYVSSLAAYGPSPQRNANGTLTTAAAAGRTVFLNSKCATCHSGPAFTDSALNRFRDIGTLKPSSGQRLGATLTGLDTPTLRGLWETAPYLHDGTAPTIAAAIQAHTGVSLNATDLANLSAYLGQIDDSETTAGYVPSVTLTGPANATGPFTVNAGFSVSVTGLTASDFTLTNATAGAVTGSGSAWTFTVNPTGAGSVTVKLPASTVTEAAGNTNVASNTITVLYTPANRAPVLTNPGSQSTERGTIASLQLAATDPDGNTLTFSASGLPAGLTVNAGTGLISGTVSGSAAASNAVTISVTDGSLSASQSFTWSTTAPPPPPPPSANGLRGEYFIGMTPGTATPAITRIDPEINFDWGNGSPDPAIPNDQFSVRWTGEVQPGFSDTYHFVIPSDNGLRLWVNNQLIIDQWLPVGNGGWFEGTIALQANVRVPVKIEYYEEWGGAGLTTYWYGESQQGWEVIPSARLYPPGSSDSTPPSVALAAPSPVTGPFTVTATFSEAISGLTASDFALTRGTAGTLTGSGTTWTLTVNPTGSPVLISLPAGAVTDLAGNAGTASNSLSITYNAPANRPPVITPPGNQSATRGQAVSLALSASDPDGNTLTFSATGLPAGLSIHAGTGLISGIVSTTAAATASTTVTVRDPSNASASTSFTWAISDAPANGLRGEYYLGMTPGVASAAALIRTDAAIDFDWGSGSPDPAIPDDQFSIRWTGEIQPGFSDTYHFVIPSDNGIRLWVNNQLIIDQWLPVGTGGWFEGTIALQANVRVPIKLEYYEEWGGAGLTTFWYGESQQPWENIPSARLFPGAAVQQGLRALSMEDSIATVGDSLRFDENADGTRDLCFVQPSALTEILRCTLEMSTDLKTWTPLTTGLTESQLNGSETEMRLTDITHRFGRASRAWFRIRFDGL